MRPIKSDDYRKPHNLAFSDNEWQKVQHCKAVWRYDSVADILLEYVDQLEDRWQIAERERLEKERAEQEKEFAEMRAMIRAHKARIAKKNQK